MLADLREVKTAFCATLVAIVSSPERLYSASPFQKQIGHKQQLVDTLIRFHSHVQYTKKNLVYLFMDVRDER